MIILHIIKSHKAKEPKITYKQSYHLQPQESNKNVRNIKYTTTLDIQFVMGEIKKINQDDKCTNKKVLNEILQPG